MKTFAELTEREVLAVAISSEEEDSRIYMGASRSPSSSAAIFACVAFSVSRNGSLGDTRWSITNRDSSSRRASPRISWMRCASQASATALAT